MQRTILSNGAAGALILGAALFATSALAQAGPSAVPDELGRIIDLPSGAKGVVGLREALDIPVDSIVLRRAFPDHPVGLPARPGAPTPGEPPAGEEPPEFAALVGFCDTIGGTDYAGVLPVATQDNGICTNADIDTYLGADGVTTYAVQAEGTNAAWIVTDLSDPYTPIPHGPYCWVSDGACDQSTYTPDVKAFRQGGNDYIVMALERTALFGFCGVIIYNVTNPAVPVFVSQTFKSGGRPRDRWCDVHNVFVEKDSASGEANYIYLTADATNDLRVLDISGTQGGTVASPKEIGRYTASTANNDNYVHDVTVVDHGGDVGRRVYLAYWNSGVVVVDAADVTPGTNPMPIIGPNDLDPPGFLNHHSFPTQDGNFVFIQDEFMDNALDEPVQMWNITDPKDPVYVDGLELGYDVPANPAHNLEIRYDIDPNRLYVAWYLLGLRAWDFTTTEPTPGFDRPNSAPETSVLHHKPQVGGGAYYGAWGVRLAPITTDPGTGLEETSVYVVQSDRRFGLVVDCLNLDDDPETCDPFTVHDIAVTAVTATPSSVLVGGWVNVEVNLQNLHNVDENVEVSLTEQPDDALFASQQIALGAGLSDTVSFMWLTTATSNGDHTLTATATLLDGVSDVDLSNNSGSDVVTVSGNDSGTDPVVDTCNPSSGNPRERINVTVAGSNFAEGATADFGAGIAVQKIKFNSSSELVVTVKINRNAASGSRDVTITNSDSTYGTGNDCFEVN